MADWVCYMIACLDDNGTYIGASNNQPKRLHNHNTGRGARRTKGKTWVPIVVISGFPDKKSCLSFESGWKRLHSSRSETKLQLINLMAGTNYRYSSCTKWNRLLDLLWFSHNFTYIDTKFISNAALKHPVCEPPILTVNTFAGEFIKDFPWPHFVIVYDKMIISS